MTESDADQFEEDRGEGRVRAASSLTILSASMPPTELADAIGLEPDEAWTKGELRRPGRSHPFNGVSYESGLDEKRTPSDHFSALIERLRPYADEVRAVGELPTTHSVRVYVVEHTLCDNQEAWLEPSDLSVVVQMRATIMFDIYFYDEDE